MKCFARWHKGNESGALYRDQTILQFGDSWELRASFVLLNPGSAVPLNETDQTEYLRTQALPFFVEPVGGETYVEFSIDRLMNDVIKLFFNKHSGGTIKLYNLFNLKNQNSGEAMEQFSKNQTHSKIFTEDQDIKFCDAPVIIASGKNVNKNLILKQEVMRYISLANANRLYKIARAGKKSFSIVKAAPDKHGLVDSYHPSYTFKYGNSTTLAELSA